ncbi:MAG: ABC transporter permease, partial [Bryobacterales bacterium]|nr:ABC transporter permease [Bryobacterales bacterium]
AMTGSGPARPVRAVLVDTSFFHTLGVQPALGRTFALDDEKRGCSVVLTHGFWQDKLGGNDGITGQQLTLDHRQCAVLGVMPRGFGFYPPATEMWLLLTPDFRPRREQMGVGIFARLAPGVTTDQAQSELRALYGQTDRAPGSDRESIPKVYALQGELTYLASPTLRATLVALSGAVLFVLLIACVNVAGLMLGRSAARERELVVRAALGAARHRLVGQLLTEGLLVSLAGTALGILFAYGALQYFRYANPVELPVNTDIALHTPVLVFTGGLSIVSTLLFALIPALRASRIDLNQVVRTGGRGAIHSGMRLKLAGSLIVAEVALSVALLAGAGLLIESVLRLGVAPLGFTPEGLVSMKLSLPEESYRESVRQLRFYDELRQRITSIPGVEDAALINWSLRGQKLEVAGQPHEPRDIGSQAVTPNWLAVMKVPLLRGRFFTGQDLSNSTPVAVINEKLARHYFPASDAIGQQVRSSQPGGENPWLTIVGIVGNVRDTNYNWNMQPVEPEILYRPMEQAPSGLAYALVRTTGLFGGVEDALRHEVTAVDSNVPVYDLQTWASRLAKDLAYPRFRALVFGGFAAFALVLAAVGLYGLLGQFVAHRRQEFAVRMAVGASSASIFRLVARQGGVPVVAGLVIGVSAAVALSRGIATLLYGVRPAEPLTLIGVSVVLLIVAGIAITLPALRGASVDPMAILRDE